MRPQNSDVIKGVRIGTWICVAVASAWGVVGFAASAWGGLPTAAPSAPLTSSAWNDVVGQINQIAGAVTVDGTRLSTSLPTANGHVATKAYVDAAMGWGAAYVGKTTTSYTGNLGGMSGAAAKCQAAFAGSHMCSANEMIKAGVGTASALGWVRCETVADMTTMSTVGLTCDGLQITRNYSSVNCSAWSSDTASLIGTAYYDTLSSYTTCDQPKPIHCCK